MDTLLKLIYTFHYIKIESDNIIFQLMNGFHLQHNFQITEKKTTMNVTLCQIREQRLT